MQKLEVSNYFCSKSSSETRLVRSGQKCGWFSSVHRILQLNHTGEGRNPHAWRGTWEQVSSLPGIIRASLAGQAASAPKISAHAPNSQALIPPPQRDDTPHYIRIRNFTNKLLNAYIVYKNTSTINELASRGLDFGLRRSFIFCTHRMATEWRGNKKNKEKWPFKASLAPEDLA